MAFVLVGRTLYWATKKSSSAPVPLCGGFSHTTKHFPDTSWVPSNSAHTNHNVTCASANQLQVGDSNELFFGFD